MFPLREQPPGSEHDEYRRRVNTRERCRRAQYDVTPALLLEPSSCLRSVMGEAPATIRLNGRTVDRATNRIDGESFEAKSTAVLDAPIAAAPQPLSVAELVWKLLADVVRRTCAIATFRIRTGWWRTGRGARRCGICLRQSRTRHTEQYPSCAQESLGIPWLCLSQTQSQHGRGHCNSHCVPVPWLQGRRQPTPNRRTGR